MAKKLEKSPAGIAIYPRVTGSPDTKFEPAGVYRTKIRVSAQDEVEFPKAKALVERIDAAVKQELKDEAERRKEAKAKDKTKVFKPLKEADKPYVVDEETGDIIFSFKMKASGESVEKDGTKRKWEQRPAIFDAKGKPLDKQIGGGTKMRTSYEFSTFYMGATGGGVSLKLKAVQVLTLVEFGTRDAAGYGFEDESTDDDTETTEGTETPADAIEGAGENTSASDDF